MNESNLVLEDVSYDNEMNFFKNPEKINLVADFFKVFGDPTRIRILSVLAIAEMKVCNIANALGMTDSAISHQLKKLRDAKLVKNRRSGKEIYYMLDDDHVNVILKQGTKHVLKKNYLKGR